MADPAVTRERSSLMAKIHGRDTKPEKIVRSLAHRLGYRFRLHRRDLPGTPDLVFPIRRKVIFVHGCFWHRHYGCKKTTNPKLRGEFWQTKFSRNVERDAGVTATLQVNGWKVLVIWECETQDLAGLEIKLNSFLVE